MVEPRWTDGSPHEDAAAAAYDRLVAQAQAGERRFERAFTTHLHVVEDGWVSLTELDDDFHSMRAALRIAGDGEIVEAAGRMLRHPFDTCPRALESLAHLIGANVARPSAHHQVKERMPRREGCLHVADMLTVAFRAFRISKGHDLPAYAGETARKEILTLLPNVRDTCVSFAIARGEG